jgi:FtsH-binding integral membrane protein
MSNWNEGVLDRSNTKLFTRNILRNVYVWMTIALGITAVVSYGMSLDTKMVLGLYQSGIIYGVLIAQVIIAIALGGFIMKMPPLVAVAVFAVYAVLMGVGLSGIFIVYQIGSIFKAFFSAAVMFGVMSAYGIFTKRDLTSWGTFLGMAVIGLVIASVINMFIHAGPLDMIISIVAIIVFTGLTAYDTQKIKQMSASFGDKINDADYIRLSINGALMLYIDFINIFVSLLRIFGDRR